MKFFSSFVKRKAYLFFPSQCKLKNEAYYSGSSLKGILTCFSFMMSSKVDANKKASNIPNEYIYISKATKENVLKRKKYQIHFS